MNKLELKNRIHQLEKELAEMKEELNKKDNRRWKPEDNEKYWYITDCEKINNNIWKNYIADNYRYNSNNCFKTKQEAEHYLELLTIENELRQFAEENNVEEIDWNDLNQAKYYLEYDFEEDCFVYDEISYSQTYDCRIPRVIYFTNDEVRRQAIDKIGKERVKMYLKEL